MPSGGARQPNNPAPVSGPGQLSRRTDGGPGGKQPIRVPTGGDYGDATQMMKLQQDAPLGASPGGQVAPGLLEGLGLPEMTPFGAPSEQPDTPVTDGAAMGAGAGPEALNMTPQQDDDLQRMIKYLPVFEHMAEQPGSSKAARNLVRSLKGLL
jgi:hypothetical protein